QLKGSVNLTSLQIDASFSVRIPIIGTFQLASFQGNLIEGVKFTFGISGILSGEARVYLKDKWLWLDLSATVFGSKYGPLSIKLIPLPYVFNVF
ncbi:hypothetical protein CONPUDRAFT_66572, partial [Coniophora puteana RWD-64-598 SS2]